MGVTLYERNYCVKFIDIVYYLSLQPLVAELYSDSRNLELTPLRQELTVHLEEMTNTGNGKVRKPMTIY